MTKKGKWVRGVYEYWNDHDYTINDLICAFVRPKKDKWSVYTLDKHNTKLQGKYDDLETAKAVAVALVAMR